MRTCHIGRVPDLALAHWCSASTPAKVRRRHRRSLTLARWWRRRVAFAGLIQLVCNAVVSSGPSPSVLPDTSSDNAPSCCRTLLPTALLRPSYAADPSVYGTVHTCPRRRPRSPHWESPADLTNPSTPALLARLAKATIPPGVIRRATPPAHIDCPLRNNEGCRASLLPLSLRPLGSAACPLSEPRPR
ncbi:hypothetical protein Micbo1qcDRAFT_163339 [Microdochium bolleyi]|uniref:Uncharacterized protein n=1 Tax=Microdochium bolleyi TaxID=196109 RepID=A0A136J2Z8_9PEZI|nr:hypothetical protein Micbo1qcDRAFT_163339 [Microdochium bolleyi]